MCHTSILSIYSQLLGTAEGKNTRKDVSWLLPLPAAFRESVAFIEKAGQSLNSLLYLQLPVTLHSLQITCS